MRKRTIGAAVIAISAAVGVATAVVARDDRPEWRKIPRGSCLARIADGGSLRVDTDDLLECMRAGVGKR